MAVRGVALHIALDKEFLSPNGIMLGYALRSDFLHGSPHQPFQIRKRPNSRSPNGIGLRQSSVST
jgi:hypothetical protein